MMRVLSMLLLWMFALPAFAVETEQPDAFAQVDAKFGQYLVAPMAKVMFWDIAFWDNSLPVGVIPESTDGGPFLIDGVEVVAVDGDDYILATSTTGPLADAVLLLDEPQTRVAGSIAVTYTSGDEGVVGTVKAGPMPLLPCAEYAACGVPLAETDAARAGDTVTLPSAGGDVTVSLPEAVAADARVLTDRAPFPVVVLADDKGELHLVGATVPVPTDMFPVVPGVRVILGDISHGKVTGEVLSVDGDQVTVRNAEQKRVAGPLANPGDLQIPLVVAWLVFGSVFFTLRMGFINIRAFGHSLAVTAGHYDHPDHPGEISHFKALSSALSATVGLGNIAGVAIAVAVGGPGAIPWMILAGFLGMSSKFSECTLGQMYRHVDANGVVSGGPFRYLHAGLKDLGIGPLGRVLSVVFAIMCIGGSLGGGNMFQANQSFEIVADTLSGIDPALAPSAMLYGLVLAGLVGMVILGGIKRIGSAAGYIVPAMCGMYVVAAGYILIVNASAVPAAFGTMFSGAFSLDAGIGGLLGALIQGFRRAAFSNEAGVGSASIAHSAAATDEPVREGIVALLGPFIDTIIVCTMTGLVVVVTGAYLGDVGGGGVLMTSVAFGSAVSWFPYILTVAVVLFAFSTMISWSYYGERCATFLFGPKASIPYKILFLICVFLGSVFKLGNVLDFSDLMILGMAFPNILGVILLSGKVKRGLDDYWGRVKSGEIKPQAR
jgi:alanine or glycine:cation symporter, AGCS family